MKLDAAMQEIRSSVPPEPLKVQVTIVEGVRGIYRCKHCGEQNFLDPGTYEPVESKKDYPRTLDGEVVADEPEVQRALPSPEPHPNTLPRRDPGSIHNAPGARCPPLDYSAIAADAWCGGGAVKGNPFGTKGHPKPDFSAGHPLRDPNDWDVVPK